MSTFRTRTTWAAVLASALAAGTMSAPTGHALAGAATADPAHSFTAKISVADGPSCSGTLVNNTWLLTAASCFADPASGSVPTGAPKRKSTAIIGRFDLRSTQGEERQIIHLVPRQDRDLVLARLSAPVYGIGRLRPATAAPSAGESLRITGFGRTRTTWVPNAPRTGTSTVTQVQPTSVQVSGATVCKGDAGAPAVRSTDGRLELAGIVTRSTHAGCLGSEETRTGAEAVRVDDLGQWIKESTAATLTKWKTQMVTKTDTGLFHTMRDSNGDWSNFGDVQKVAGGIEDLAYTANAANYGKNYVFAVGGNGRLYEANRRPTGGWAPFRDITDELGNKPGLTTVAVTSMGRSLGLIGLANGRVYHAIQDPDEKWSKWGDVTAKLGMLGNAKQLTIARTSDGRTHVGVVADKKAYHAIREADGSWTKWGGIASLPTGLTEFSAMTYAGIGNELQVVVAGPAGELRHATRRENGSWTSFGNLGSKVGVTKPLASLDATGVAGEFQVAFATVEGRILHTTRHEDGSWDDVEDLHNLPGKPEVVALTGSVDD